ncbi:histone H1-like [Sinocyclocheilus grahami]|uniref:histone H1-like n=1 Tax=Sinocyclocheilus grahami TaxID=75366 RepID=UPI0007AD3F96|nr:PREDICTED: histone H1-like [Sinocyclocheilus grahami]
MAETDPAATETKAAKKISAAKHKTMGPKQAHCRSWQKPIQQLLRPKQPRRYQQLNTRQWAPSKLTVSASKERKGTLVQTKGTGTFSSFKLNKKQAETKTKPTKKATPKDKKPAAKKPAATKKPKTTAAKKSLKKVKKPAAKKKMKRP